MFQERKTKDDHFQRKGSFAVNVYRIYCMIEICTFKSVTLQIQDITKSPRAVSVDAYIMKNAEISFGDATGLKADSVSSDT